MRKYVNNFKTRFLNEVFKTKLFLGRTDGAKLI